MIDIYGIPNCGSVKKALAWARDNGVEFTFHDFKKEPPTEALLEGWMKQIPANTLVNAAGPSWRKLDPEVREACKADAAAMKTQMLATPNIIKRPVIVWADGSVTRGVDEALWAGKAH
ncbi:Spx/MgsR family RNA polymerase-binding regulatory protein [Sutterella sp.]|uniref:Spx/MgsR family RNA polymerase-binding regulatory protein n=1 Tax=Sutterella sp. TaxID=1981025 RepID=UPI0026DFAB49|nr:Spx/MgsR family RNA polymerase-binding regulatory protein [Sutterella sp.]MDO5530608.1 Spx/MgsR family RNA polymerase-binding regulatory protein [Sutterella sp.]